jgi:hypothetical protein
MIYYIRLFISLGNDDSTPCENNFTDEGMIKFLATQKNIKTLKLEHSGSISGKMFASLGSSKLEKLLVQRFV